VEKKKKKNNNNNITKTKSQVNRYPYPGNTLLRVTRVYLRTGEVKRQSPHRAASASLVLLRSFSRFILLLISFRYKALFVAVPFTRFSRPRETYAISLLRSVHYSCDGEYDDDGGGSEFSWPPFHGPVPPR